MFILKILLLCIAVYYSLEIDNSEIFCSKAFCKTYKVLNRCPDIPKACRIQNSTHNGVFLPFYGPCNCCDYCIENLKKGDKCGTGSIAGSPTPKTICGEGLTCKYNGKDTTCQDINSPCIKLQIDWDKHKQDGTLGHMTLRPQCDRKGKFMPTKCIPGETCFCISEDGDRLFGEVPYTSQAQSFMKCGCSRSVYTANKITGDYSYSLMRPRCQLDGNFDPIQCFNSTCMCVDSEDGFPDAKSKIHITLVNKQNMPCFDDKIHVAGDYYRSCDKEYEKKLKEVESYKEKGLEVIGEKFPNCQLDGKYASIQEDNTFKYCADPDNKVLSNADNKEYILAKSEPLAATMNCKCARASSIIEGKEKPKCCSNGNYQIIQCRRGLCRCVDSDGMQIQGKETEIENINTLPCYNENNEKMCT